jgi:hypothetical protein
VRLAHPNRRPDGRSLALLDFQRGKFRFPISILVADLSSADSVVGIDVIEVSYQSACQRPRPQESLSHRSGHTSYHVMAHVSKDVIEI